MPRPQKNRRICTLPTCHLFGPITETAVSCSDNLPEVPRICLSFDEYEAIRLIDLEGLTQENCAEHMGVARTTVQSIYTSARTKLADCLVNGRELRIGGGNIVVCSGRSSGCRCVFCIKGSSE
jgi:predicted DNA-binding protein (UPF0251 family)